MFQTELLQSIRSRFHYVESCPYQGERIYFENAGGSLTLKSVVEVCAALSAVPDNYGRDNAASKALMEIAAQGTRDMMLFMGAQDGMVFVGETGTECLFRLIRAAALTSAEGGNIVGSTFEHPATMSAGRRWAKETGRDYVSIAHDSETGELSAQAYQGAVSSETRIATINQTNPVTGVSVDINEICSVIRRVAPDCFIVIDGIQHAPHGTINVAEYGADAYVVSGYKMFAKHNFGVAWISPRLATVPHDKLDGTAEDFWTLGTRDTSDYAAFSEVVNYQNWLGAHFTDSSDSRQRLKAAGQAIKAQEQYLIELMMCGVDGQLGLDDLPTVTVLAGNHHARREGVVSIVLETIDSMALVQELAEAGVCVHSRSNDLYSGSMLAPLGLDSCVRISLAHYNSGDEVLHFLRALTMIIAGPR